MSKLKHYVGLILIVQSQLVFAQKFWTDQAISAYVINTNESANNNENFEQLMILVLEKRENPIDLNEASVDELLAIPLMNIRYVNLIMNHKQLYGEFLHTAELGAVEGISFEDATWIAQFVKVSSNKLGMTKTNNPFQLMSTHVFKSKQNKTYVGDAWQQRVKALVQINSKLQLGFTLEKDAGEAWKNLANGLFDYPSFYLAYNGNKCIKQLVIGDFEMHTGQGLSLGMGYQIRMSSDPIQTIQLNTVLNKHVSFNEANFMRGIAFQFQFKNWTIYPFISSKKTDAKIASDSINTQDFIVSESNSGYHRTPSEIANQKTLNQVYWGTYIQTQTKQLQWGFSYFQLKQSAAKINSKNTPSKWVVRALSNYSNFGIDLILHRDQNIYTTAISIDEFGDYALYFALMKSMGKMLDWGCSVRAYSPFYSNPLAAGPLAFPSKNQKGLFQSLCYAPTKKWTFKAYIDVFESTWLNSTLNNIDEQSKLSLQTNYLSSTKTQMSLQYRYLLNKSKEIEALFTQTKQQLSLNYSTEISAHFSINGKFQSNDLHQINKAKSFLMYQSFNFKSKGLQMHLQLSEFENHHSQQIPVYVHEHDLTGQSGMQVFYGSGYAGSIVVKLSLKKHLKLGLKIGTAKQMGQDLFSPTYKFQLQWL
jgi:hypothetical protein